MSTTPAAPLPGSAWGLAKAYGVWCWFPMIGLEREMTLELLKQALPEVVLVSPRRHADDRGWFCETYNKRAAAEAGLHVEFVQDNHSFSAPQGTVRGLHYQAPPFAQDKLVRVVRGSIFDVAVDARRGSPTYGRWVGAEISAENGLQFFVPVGFLHGFITLEPDTEVVYKVSNYYSKECDGSVRFDDPDLGIDWGPAAENPALSEKDSAATRWADFNSPFEYFAND